MSKQHDAIKRGIPEFPHAHSVQGLADWMDVMETEGLANEEADERRTRFGPNALDQEPPEPWWRTLVRQFLTPMIYLLAAASLISFFMGEALDGMAILIVVLINGVIGFITEFRAEKALQALKSMISLQATVKRNGRILKLNSEDIVPGDIVLLEAGDVVPADARIIKSRNLSLDEAALTGESLPVNKTWETLPESTPIADRINCVFSGTSVVRGNGEALVFATGMDSQIGLISGMLATVQKQRTPLEERLERLSGFLIKLVVGVAVFVVGLGFLQGRGFLHMLETGIALAVAAVPEGLPFVATMTLALGVHRMAGVNALVRNLSSVETLGSTTVVCTDKTGTLTLNDMAVRELWPVDVDTVEDIYRVSVLCNKATPGEKGKSLGDPMEVALLAYCRDKGVDIEMIRRTFPVTDEEPFDSSTMRMVTWHDEGVAVKGAPEKLIGDASFYMEKGEKKTITATHRKQWMEKVESMASRGMRTLGFAWGGSLDDLVFLGVAGILDPPRPEVPESVRSCREAGMHVVMITGDHLTTACSIAEEVGILTGEQREAFSGNELENMDEDELSQHAGRIGVFARVAPEHKLKIVRALQKAGHVVAMTGDGVNDAVALKQADVGVAMGIQGTEVSKEASDIILQDDRFATIVLAIKEGRRIFDNIRKSVLFLLCCNLSEVLTVVGGILFRMPAILLPLQILWINLITDVAPALALALDPAESDVMKRPPKKRMEDILTRDHKFNILLYGIIMSLGVFAAFGFSLVTHPGDGSRAAEMGFHTLVFAQLFFVYNVRGRSLFRNPGQLFSNLWLIGGVGFSMMIQVGITYVPVFQRALDIVPLAADEWLVVAAGALLPTLLAQVRKFLRGD